MTSINEKIVLLHTSINFQSRLHSSWEFLSWLMMETPSQGRGEAKIQLKVSSHVMLMLISAKCRESGSKEAQNCRVSCENQKLSARSKTSGMWNVFLYQSSSDLRSRTFLATILYCFIATNGRKFPHMKSRTDTPQDSHERRKFRPAAFLQKQRHEKLTRF